MKKYNVFLSIFIVYIVINMVIFPKIYINTTFNGILAWACNVLPSVLPFLIFSKLLNSLGFIQKSSKFFSPLCKKLFNCPSESSFVFLTSIISGYPIGASMTADLYQNGKISKSEAFRMCSFCSTSGPMFIVGCVGTVLLNNSTYGYIILSCHIIGAIINGLLYRNITAIDLNNHNNASIRDKKQDFSSIVQSSTLNILSVGAIIAVFFVVITALSPIFNIFPPQISCILEGLVEITKGCTSIAQNYNGILAIVFSTLIISFGGISSILQSIAMLSKLKMPIKTFIAQKTTHAIISTGLSLIICMILL